MKDSKNNYVKSYFHAFYYKNRGQFILALVLVILNFPASLVGSWLLGRVIDVIASGDLQQLKEVLIFSIGFVTVMFLVSAAMYRAKSRKPGRYSAMSAAEWRRKNSGVIGGNVCWQQ